MRKPRIRFIHGDRPVVSMNLCNGSIGYLCPAAMHSLDLYQVWQSPFERGSLERLIGAALEATLKQGR